MGRKFTIGAVAYFVALTVVMLWVGFKHQGERDAFERACTEQGGVAWYPEGQTSMDLNEARLCLRDAIPVSQP